MHILKYGPKWDACLFVDGIITGEQCTLDHSARSLQALELPEVPVIVQHALDFGLRLRDGFFRRLELPQQCIPQ